MRKRVGTGACIIAVACVGIGIPAYPQPPSPVSRAGQKDMSTSTHASGSFDVKLNPQPADGYADGVMLGRMSIDKQFRGDLEGTSKGQMLTGLTSLKDSAGYVAIERVSGRLQGRTGTFVLQHSATMVRGAQDLSITVVPDSGTGELVGLAGKMGITIAADGKHSYDFAYTLPPVR